MTTFAPSTSSTPPAPVALDDALIQRAKAGDHAAFEVLFTQYHTAIYNYIHRLMGSSQDAYDMTQDVFLKAYLALPRTSDDLKVGAWLYRIATNLCYDEMRHRRLIHWEPWETFISVFHPGHVAKDSPERECIHKENTAEVQVILEQMLPKYREVLVLREYQDLSYDQIAAVLGITRAAVKSLLFRAREEFRQVYATGVRAEQTRTADHQSLAGEKGTRGALLRQRRRALGLSQRAIGVQAERGSTWAHHLETGHITFTQELDAYDALLTRLEAEAAKRRTA